MKRLLTTLFCVAALSAAGAAQANRIDEVELGFDDLYGVFDEFPTGRRARVGRAEDSIGVLLFDETGRDIDYVLTGTVEFVSWNADGSRATYEYTSIDQRPISPLLERVSAQIGALSGVTDYLLEIVGGLVVLDFADTGFADPFTRQLENIIFERRTRESFIDANGEFVQRDLSGFSVATFKAIRPAAVPAPGAGFLLAVGLILTAVRRSLPRATPRSA